MMDSKAILKALKDAKNDDPKVPKVASRHVGIEVELVSPVSRDTLRAIFALSDMSKYVNVGTDGSIDVDDEDEYDAECRILCKESEYEEVLKNFFAIVNALDCYVNDSCGLHVHIDARSRNVHDMFENFYAAQDLLFSCVDKERRDNEYCPHVTKDEYTRYQVKKDLYAVDRGAINIGAYNRHKTVEIRLHHATLDANTVCNWIKLLTTVADLKKPVPSWTLLKSTKLEADTKSWVNGRIRQYGKHKVEDEEDDDSAEYSYSYGN